MSSSIYSNFGAYRTPKRSEYAQVMRSGMVVLDANVLLSLYRYNDQARQDLLAALNKIKATLWVPHQVMKEFWGARLSALDARERRAQQLCDEMGKAFHGVRGLLRDWAPMVSLKDAQLKAMFGRIDECSEKLQEEVLEISRVGDRGAWMDTNNDPVVSELETILDGCVGSPLSEEEETAARNEATRRAGLEIPPGYRDAKKEKKQGPDSGDSAGDYLCVLELGGDAIRGDGAAALMLLFAVGFPALAVAWIAKRGDPDAVALAVTFAGALAIAWIVAIGDERREDAVELCASN